MGIFFLRASKIIISMTSFLLIIISLYIAICNYNFHQFILKIMKIGIISDINPSVFLLELLCLSLIIIGVVGLYGLKKSKNVLYIYLFFVLFFLLISSLLIKFYVQFNCICQKQNQSFLDKIKNVFQQILCQKNLKCYNLMNYPLLCPITEYQHSRPYCKLGLDQIYQSQKCHDNKLIKVIQRTYHCKIFSENDKQDGNRKHHYKQCRGQIKKVLQNYKEDLMIIILSIFLISLANIISGCYYFYWNIFGFNDISYYRKILQL